MLSWMLYAIIVSLLMGLGALALERSAQIRQRPTRWLWGACLVASLAILFVPQKASVHMPATTHADRTPSSEMPTPPQTKPIELSRLTLPIIGTDQLPLSDGATKLLDWIWRVTSMALALVILASGAHLSWRRRRWDRGHMAGTAVYISDDCGPAVVGFFRPHIVVPRWLTGLSPDEQELVIAHERSHLGAHDTQLLTIAVCLLACMPWNPILWWQLRRLRLAIEIDCDARVLRLGYPVARYSETLIAVGERQSASYAMTMAGYGSKSFLEQRIHNMLRKKTRHARVSALALACLGVGLAVCAAEVAPPKVDLVGKTSPQGISVDRQLLQANGQTGRPGLAQPNSSHAGRAHRRQACSVHQGKSEPSRLDNAAAVDEQAPSISVGSTRCGFCARFPPSPSCRNSMPRARSSSRYRAWPWTSLDSGTDYSKEAKFTETVAKKIYYGPVYMRRESEPYMTMGMAGWRSDAGVSLVELNLKPMWDIVQQTRVGDRGVAYVVSAEGRRHRSS